MVRPVIVALELADARRLLDDEALARRARELGIDRGTVAPRDVTRNTSDDEEEDRAYAFRVPTGAPTELACDEAALDGHAAVMRPAEDRLAIRIPHAAHDQPCGDSR